MADFFISYTQADRAWAEWIASKLEDEGFKVELQAWTFRESESFIGEMNRALTECRFTLAVYSEPYFASKWCQREWEAAFKLEKLKPVRVQPCDNIPPLLQPIIYTDLVGKTEPEARVALRQLAGVAAARPANVDFPGNSVANPVSTARFPGELPPTFTVPLLRNPHFTGRDEEMRKLESALKVGAAAITATPQALSGLGGVGKTQLAVEYAYRFSDRYDAVLWVSAEATDTLGAGFGGLAAALDLPEQAATETATQVAAVKHWLEHHGRWLLIFDNATDEGSLDGFLPHRIGGHILITSRSAHWERVAQSLPLDTWPRADSIAFLQARTGESGDAADRLAEELGDLPLALEQAAAYIVRTKIDCAGYLTRLSTAREKLLKAGRPYRDGKREETVATTWEVSLEALSHDSPAALQLLYVCAFLAPDDIPRDLLASLPFLENESAVDDAVDALRGYSLIQASPETVSIHRLVQTVVRDRLDAPARATSCTAVADLVRSAWPMDHLTNTGSWPRCLALLPHARAAAGHAEALGVAPETSVILFNEAGLYLRTRAELGPAHECLDRAVRLGETALGSDHPDLSTFVNNLGSALLALGDMEGAKACCERALRIGENALGSDHPDVSRLVNNLGEVLREQGNVAGATYYFERAIRIYEGIHEPDHPRVATYVNNLGNVLWYQGNLVGAKDCFERAIRIDEATYGPDHIDVAVDVNNLGNVLRAQGDLDGAKRCYERAHRIDETAYGPDHPGVAIDLSNLGGVLQAQGDLRNARSYLERALTIFRKFLPDGHPNTRTAAAILADITAKIERQS